VVINNRFKSSIFVVDIYQIEVVYMPADVKIECEQCKQKVITSGLTYKDKWFCSKKCLDEYKKQLLTPKTE